MYLKKYDENDYAFYKNSDFSLIVNESDGYSAFCGYIRYDTESDFTDISSLEIEYSGEFLECSVDNIRQVNIGGKMIVNTSGLRKKSKVSLVTATTMGYKFSDRYSAYGYRTSAFVSSVRCVKG